MVNFRMSDTEEVEKTSSTTHKRLRRKSLEIDVSELVRNNVIQTKSNDLKRQEKYYNEFEKEIIDNDAKSDAVLKELENYTTLDKNMQAYFAGDLTIDMDIHEHRELTAFLKEHVRPLRQIMINKS